MINYSCVIDGVDRVSLILQNFCGHWECVVL